MDDIDPETGEKYTKSKLKKLAKMKGKPAKDKSALKAAWGANGDANKKKEKDKKKEIPKFTYTNNTPKGDKKDMTQPMLEAYQPQAVEAAWNDWWEKEGFYGCDAEKAKGKDPKKDRFTMVIPPPNVTGKSASEN